MCSKHLTSNKGVTKSQAQTRWQQDPHREAGHDSHVSPVASAIPEGRLAFHQPAARRGQKVTPTAHPTWESHGRPLTNTETRPRPLGCPRHPPLMGWSPRGAARACQPETGCASRPSAQRLRRFSFAELPFLLRGALLAVTPRIALMASSWWEARPQIITLYLREYASPSVTIDSAIRFVGQRGS